MASDSFNDIALKMGIDSTGVTTGLQSVSRKLRQFKDESDGGYADRFRKMGTDPKVLKQQTDALDEFVFKTKAANAAKEAEWQKETDARVAAAARQRQIDDAAQRHLEQTVAANNKANLERIRSSDDMSRKVVSYHERLRNELRARNDAIARDAEAAANAETQRLVRQYQQMRNLQAGANGSVYTQMGSSGYNSQYNEDRNARTAVKLREIAAAERTLANATRDRLAAEAQVAAIVNRNMTATQQYEQAMRNLLALQMRPGISAAQRDAEAVSFTAQRVRLTRQHNAALQAQNAHMNQTVDTARVMTGVWGQLSFAAEDFFQGMLFGDVRAALLGASNNLTMVARGLWQVNTASGVAAVSMGTIAVAAGGVAAAGVAAYAAWYLFVGYAKASTKELEDSVRALNLMLNQFEGNVARAQKARAFDGMYQDLKKSEDAYKKIQEEQRRVADLQDDLKQKKFDSNLDGLLEAENSIGGERAKEEMLRYLGDIKANGDALSKATAEEASRLYAEMENAAAQGDAHRFQNAREQLQWMLMGLQNLQGDWFDLAAVNALQESFDTSWFERGVSKSASELMLEVEEMKRRGDELKKIGKDISEGEREILRLKEAQIALLQHELELKDKAEALVRDEVSQRLNGSEIQRRDAKLEADRLAERKKFMGEWHDFPLVKDGPVEDRSKEFDAIWAEHLNQQTQERQRQADLANDEVIARREILQLEMSGTELQRQQYRMQQKQEQYLGTTAAQFAAQQAAMQMGGIPGGMMAQAAAAADQAASLEFMKAAKIELEKEITAAMPQQAVQGQLGTNANAAQSSAIEQTLRSEFSKDNPQLEAMRRLLDDINRNIANGGSRLVVVP